MLNSAKLATVMMMVMIGGCATDEDFDLDIDPPCEDGEKCDGLGSEGFEIFKGADGKYYFHLVSPNGQIVMRSQGYRTKLGAKRGVESVRTNGVDETNFKVLQASSGEWYTNLYAQNHEIIGTTETYTRKFNAIRAVDTSVRLVSRAQRLRAATSGARFQTIVGADHQSYFHLRAANGEVMLASEGYIHAAGALNGIASVRENGKDPSRYQILQAANDQWYFRLRAGNNKTIGHGETYASKANAQRAVDSLVALLRSELVADPRPAEAPSRSLADFGDLVKTLDALEDVAVTPGTLSYFGFAEQAVKPAGVECETASVAEIQDAYLQLTQILVNWGDADARPDLTPSLIASSSTQLGELLGTESYEVCQRETMAGLTSTHETYFMSTQQGGPRIVLELGYVIPVE